MLQNIDWLQRMEGFPHKALTWVVGTDAFQRTFTEPVPSKRGAGRCRNRHVPRAGAFVAQTTAQVGDDTRSIYSNCDWREARRVGIPGEELLTISDQFLELEQLPQRIIFVGGGYISFEFAHVAARVGAQIQILHESDPCQTFGPLLAQLMQTTRYWHRYSTEYRC